MTDLQRSERVGPSTRVDTWTIALAGLLIVVLLATPFWGPRLLSRLTFFRVRRIEIAGARFTPVAEVVARLRIDTTRSVWDPLSSLEARLATHPEVLRARITRKLPGTLVVELTERRPVALVPRAGGLRAVDERGMELPIDPSRTPVDVPIVAATPQDGRVYHLLGLMQQEAPRLFARVGSIRAVGNDELLLRVVDLPVRAMTSLTVARLSDIEPVERDLARRGLRASELDLRYRDQVIARLP